MGSNDVILVEVTLVELGSSIGVVLRELLAGPAAPQTYRLGSAFGWVCDTLQWELVCLQGLPPKLRFFHRTYEMRPTGTLRWRTLESVTPCTGLTWAQPDTELLQVLDATWPADLPLAGSRRLASAPSSRRST